MEDNCKSVNSCLTTTFNMKRFLTLLLAIIFLPAMACQAGTAGGLCAQTPGTQTISGQVLDKDTQEPLMGATFRVENMVGWIQ